MRAGLLWLLALVGCVKPGDVPCGDHVCPSNTVCESVTLTCISHEADTICTEGPGIPDGKPCSGSTFVGVCQGGKCIPGCGDGVINSVGETCDDGNFRSHDGCASTCVVESLSWQQMLDPWTGMFGHVAGYYPGDSPSITVYNGFFIVLGGQSQSGLRTEQWLTRDTTVWQSETNSLPALRTGAAMAYDATRNKLVMFGGHNTAYLNDTWEWEYSTGWVQRTNLTGTPPPAREGAQVAYDTAHQRLVLFGGFNGTAYLTDTWEYNGAAWVERTPASGPGGRVKHAMAYDPTRDRVVLYGGNVYGIVTLSDQWEYDDGAWTQLSFGTNPGPRSGSAMAYVSDRNIVLFGGFTINAGGGVVANDTWQYNGSSWSQVTTTVAPPGRSSATLTAAPKPGSSTGMPAPFQLLLIGGEQGAGKPVLADVWRLTAAGWVDATPHRIPPARQGAPAVYNDKTREIQIFGGIGLNLRDDFWSYSDSGWTTPKQSGFIPHYFHAAGYDPVRDRVVMFGGLKDQPSTQITNETYEETANTWTRVVPGQSPSARISGVLAWDGGTLVLFGGNINGAANDETWTYDGTTWTQETKSGDWPAASFHAAAAYDRTHARLVMLDHAGMTWAHSNHKWTRLVAAGTAAPPARDDAGMTFNWLNGQMTLTGGRKDTTDLLTDVWELDDTAWRKLDVIAGGPLPRAQFGFASTPFTGETLLIGGTATGGQPADDVWRLRYTANVDDEVCDDKGNDEDGDGLADHEDPDCCGRNVPNTCFDGL